MQFEIWTKKQGEEPVFVGYQRATNFVEACAMKVGEDRLDKQEDGAIKLEKGFPFIDGARTYMSADDAMEAPDGGTPLSTLDADANNSGGSEIPHGPAPVSFPSPRENVNEKLEAFKDTVENSEVINAVKPDPEVYDAPPLAQTTIDEYGSFPVPGSGEGFDGAVNVEDIPTLNAQDIQAQAEATGQKVITGPDQEPLGVAEAPVVNETDNPAHPTTPAADATADAPAAPEATPAPAPTPEPTPTPTPTGTAAPKKGGTRKSNK